MAELPDMPVLEVPDYHGHGYPQELKQFQISKATVTLVDQKLVNVVSKDWSLLGSGETSDLPKSDELRQVDTANLDTMRKSETAAQYRAIVSKLAQAYASMQESVLAVAKKVKDSEEDRKKFQKDLEGLIANLNDDAITLPQSLSMDAHIQGYVAKRLEECAKVTAGADKNQGKNGDGVGDEAKKLKEIEDQLNKAKTDLKALQDENKKLKEQLGTGNPNNPNSPSYDPPRIPQDGSNGLGDDTFKPIDTGLDDGSKPPGLAGGQDDGSGLGTNDPSTDPSKSLDDAINQIKDDAQAGTPAAQTPSPMDSGLGGMGGMNPFGGMSPFGMSPFGMNGMGMNPYSQQEQMRREMADRDLERRRQEMEMRRAQQPGAVQASAAPQPAQTAPAAQATAQNGAPPNNAAAPPPGGPPPRVPGADGLVDYTFPDGRTQKVPPVVAQGLDVAFANTQGTDAQAAYANTPAKWTDPKQIGDRVDPSQAKTGDVATWDKNRSAIVVVFGTGQGGDAGGGLGDAAAGEPMEAIIAGQLKQLRSEDMNTLSDKTGEFGGFAGFLHPRGVDAAAPDTAGAEQGAPAGDQAMQAAVTAPS
ncbi:hypothetical protein [Nocardia wallacei]|uniref:hypothetical protein n=1 Tax=Nocardia wallacei TaxID=480035 RepID=UPI002455595D|nr:hypothetical protein [Nocardia wallacei]